MARCETIKIATDEGFKIINLDDFDPKVDKEFKEKAVRKPRSTKKDK